MSIEFEDASLSTAPDSIEPVVGWKSLRLKENGLLYSSMFPTEWSPQKRFKANCGRRWHSSSGTPSPSCTCGIYMVEDVQGLSVYHGNVIAEVQGWGRVIPGTRGWRTEYAYPSKLFLLDGTERDRRQLEERYAVPTVLTTRASFPKPVRFRRFRFSSVIQFTGFMTCVVAGVANLTLGIFGDGGIANIGSGLFSLACAGFIVFMERVIRRY